MNFSRLKILLDHWQKLVLGFVCLLPSLIGCMATTGDTYTNPVDAINDLGNFRVIIPSFRGSDGDRWFNTSSDTLDLSGKVVLVDFWDYTCVNCIRTLPYLNEWYKRYEKDGLVIIGVHSPEFDFAKKEKNVEHAIHEFNLRYPVVMDNNFKIWNRFSNRYWPAKYLFDKDGVLRAVHFGEGDYGNTEAMIQKLLMEINPDLRLPRIMEPVRQTDIPGAVCYRTTPETYLGYSRAKLGNDGGYVRDDTALYIAPATYDEDRVYLSGKWKAEPEFVRYAGSAGVGSIAINYEAAEVDLVIRTDLSSVGAAEDSVPGKVYVTLDGKPLAPDDRGTDVTSDSTGTYLKFTEARMYNIVRSEAFGRHLLRLIPFSDAFAAYAFTFVTACQIPPDRP